MSHGREVPKPPEIWMVNQYAVTPDLPGGTRHFDFGCELGKRGFTTRILASDINLALRRHTKLSKRGQLSSEENADGVLFTWVKAVEYGGNDWRRALNMLTFALNVIRVGLHLGTKPRTIIGSSPHLFAALSGWILAKIKGARFLLELRDLWPQALIDMGGLREGGLTSRALRALEAFLYRVADHIIILAPGSRHYLLKRGVPNDSITYIPNGVHLTNFASTTQHDESAANSSLASRTGANCLKRFRIVYTGAHGPANALTTILDAASILRDRTDIEFVLVGDGPSKDQLVSVAEEHNLANIRFLDAVPKAQIPRLLAAADAAVITLRHVDAFAYGISPNKLFDYMAAGKPILCAVPGYMASLVQENGVGISLEPENPRALADAAIALADMSRSERDKMGQRGKELVRREFSRETLAETLVRLL